MRDSCLHIFFSHKCPCQVLCVKQPEETFEHVWAASIQRVSGGSNQSSPQSRLTVLFFRTKQHVRNVTQLTTQLNNMVMVFLYNYRFKYHQDGSALRVRGLKLQE